MNPDIQNKIDLEAEKYAEEKLPPVLQTEYHLIQHENSFKSGASFMHGILQPEINSLNDLLKASMNVGQRYHGEIVSLKKQLTEANATIQSLKDENVRMRNQGRSDVLKLILRKEMIHMINCDNTSRTEIRDWLESQLHILDKALTQKAEE